MRALDGWRDVGLNLWLTWSSLTQICSTGDLREPRQTRLEGVAGPFGTRPTESQLEIVDVLDRRGFLLLDGLRCGFYASVMTISLIPATGAFGEIGGLRKIDGLQDFLHSPSQPGLDRFVAFVRVLDSDYSVRLSHEVKEYLDAVRRYRTESQGAGRLDKKVWIQSCLTRFGDSFSRNWRRGLPVENRQPAIISQPDQIGPSDYESCLN